MVNLPFGDSALVTEIDSSEDPAEAVQDVEVDRVQVREVELEVTPLSLDHELDAEGVEVHLGPVANLGVQVGRLDRLPGHVHVSIGLDWRGVERERVALG